MITDIQKPTGLSSIPAFPPQLGHQPVNPGHRLKVTVDIVGMYDMKAGRSTHQHPPFGQSPFKWSSWKDIFPSGEALSPLSLYKRAILGWFR